ncbi:MAG TPA: hypothetical protein PLB01_05870 [Thermoanaerobaculia bacterium]|nr:hypothetical protein [Thermoanaerobaculia bacterium]
MRNRASAPVLLYALLAVLVVPVFPHFLSPNEVSRWAFAASLVERRTPEISGVLPLLGPAFEDVSEKDGRVYSNKAPGAALVALPGALAARLIAGPPAPGSLRLSLTLMRLLAATLPAILLALVLAGAAVRFGATPARARFAAAVLLFATPLFAYGLLLFSHALVAACLFGAWAAFFAPGSGSRGRRDVLGGALLGLAVLSEYPAAVPAAVIVLCAAAVSPRRLLAIAAGGAPPALVLAAYDTVCFGSPFALSSGFERAAAFRGLAASGLFGVGLPSPSVLLRLLLDPSKGLFVFVPLLLLWPWAFPAARGRVPREGGLALALVPLSLLVLYAGYPNWHGGFTVGPRYLVAALPFLVFPLAFREGGALEAGLAGASVLACVGTTLAFPFVPPGFALPWGGTFGGDFYGKGLGAPNLFHLVPAMRGVAFVVPLLLVLAAAAALLSSHSKKRAVAFCAGVTIAAAAALVAPRLWPLSPSLVLQRAYVADVYFGRRGALEDAIVATGSPQPRLLARRERELLLPPSPWPF